MGRKRKRASTEGLVGTLLAFPHVFHCTAFVGDDMGGAVHLFFRTCIRGTLRETLDLIVIVQYGLA